MGALLRICSLRRRRRSARKKQQICALHQAHAAAAQKLESRIVALPQVPRERKDEHKRNADEKTGSSCSERGTKNQIRRKVNDPVRRTKMSIK